jgi:hypothetical protein
MKFIAKHLNWIGLFLLASFAAAAAGLYWNVPENILSPRKQPVPTTYEKKSGCCENHEPAKATPPPAAESCPHLAATAAKPGCGNGCSPH